MNTSPRWLLRAPVALGLALALCSACTAESSDDTESAGSAAATKKKTVVTEDVLLGTWKPSTEPIVHDSTELTFLKGETYRARWETARLTKGAYVLEKLDDGSAKVTIQVVASTYLNSDAINYANRILHLKYFVQEGVPSLTVQGIDTMGNALGDETTLRKQVAK